MATAIRIQKLDSSLNPVGNVDFERYEIIDTRVNPVLEANIQRAQTGKPTLFILSDQWHSVSVQFRIHGKTTQDKMTELRNYIRSGELLRIFPKWYKDQTYFFDGFVDPGTITLEFLFSGEYKMGDSINLTFFEADKSNQTVMEEDLIIT